MPDLIQTAPIEFSDTAAPPLRWGKIFASGEYADKAYSMTPDELRAAAAAFESAPVDLEHTPTVLSGKLGTLKAVKLSDDGATLLGGVEEPAWLANLLGDAPRKVSATWDRATKRLVGLAYTLNPRISDAALYSAFAAFAGQRHSSSDLKDLQQIHDLVVGQGAACQTTMSKGVPMSNLWEKLQAALTGLPADDVDAVTMSAPALPAVREPAPVAAAAPDPELARLRAQVATELERRITAEAAAFADGEVLAGRAMPAEKVAMIAAFTQAARDDAAHGVVTFADGTQHGRIETLKALYSARSSHGLTQERIQEPTLAVVLQNGATSDEQARQRAAYESLLGATPAGQATLQRKKGAV